MLRIDSEPVAQQLVSVRIGFRPEVACVDVVQIVEVRLHPDRLEHPPRIRRIAVGEHEIASREAGERVAERLVAGHAIKGNGVHVSEKVVGVDPMLLHQARKRGPVLVEVTLLDALRFSQIAIQQALNIGAHPLVDQREQPRRRRIEAVVEVENPVVDMAETRVHHSAAA